MFRKAFHVTCVLAALFVVSVTVSAMMPFDRATYFAFSRPVQVAGVVLPTGHYVFEIVNPTTSANVVRVRDRKRTKMYVNTLTRPIMRPSTTRMEAMIVFGESSATSPRPIRAWYPAGVTTGYEFLR